MQKKEFRNEKRMSRDDKHEKHRIEMYEKIIIPKEEPRSSRTKAIIKKNIYLKFS